ncbi:trypsin-like peptidase domain-containing protein [Argonema antarcticum A004/B2]|nr:COP23 domain-containing protein [Argonema antarcticum]MCL1472206.1 trypsin-like peptidase domain-containing protein [Argonema antarcticum A004/B2]
MSVSADETPPTSQQTTNIPESVRQVTVRFEIRYDDDKSKTPKSDGSGVIISTQGNKYTVLTADHVLLATKADINNIIRPQTYVFADPRKPTLIVVTHDGKEHQVKAEQVIRLRSDPRKGLDLALVTFEVLDSSIYPVAKLSAFAAQELNPTGVYGWPALEPDPEKLDENPLKPNYGTGTILELRNLDESGRISKGYAMTYDATTASGMSGGPAVDENNPDLVIGIHGNGGRANIVVIPEISGIFTASYTQRYKSSAIPIQTFINQIRESNSQKRNWFFSQISQELIDSLKKQIEDTPPQSNTQNAAESKYIQGLRLLRNGRKMVSKGKTTGNAETTGNGEKSLNDAIDSFKEVVMADKDYLEAYAAMADAYYFLKDYKNAHDNYKLALDNTNRVNAKQRYDEEKEEKEEIVEESKKKFGNPDLFRTNILLKQAAVYFEEGLVGEADKEIKKILTKEEIKMKVEGKEENIIYPADNRPHIYLIRALININTKKEENQYLVMAEKEACKLAKQYDDNKKECASVTNKGDATNEVDATGLVSVGMYYYQYKHNEDKALKIWERAIKAAPEDSYIYIEIGKYLNRNGNRDLALKFWQGIEDKMAKDPLVMRQLSDVYDYYYRWFNEKQNAPENANFYRKKALDTINMAVKLTEERFEKGERPDLRAEVYTELGIRLRAYNDLPGAIQELNKAYKIYSDRGDSLNAREIAQELCQINQTDCSKTHIIIPPQGTNPPSGQNPNPIEPKPPETVVIKPPITQTFYCDPTSGRVTVDRTQNGDRPLIRWESNRFTPWGYDPRLRCQQVSARLQEYRASGDLDSNRITYGRMNRRTILCVARPERFLESSATRCRGGLLILTLEPRQNPEQVLREFKQVLTGTYPNPPLRKELSNPASKE